MSQSRVVINFFSPHGEILRREVNVIRLTLLCWAIISFGLPLVVWLAGLGDPNGLGESWLTRNRMLFGFPMHYWLIAQGATFGYLALCRVYCTLRRQRLAPVLKPRFEQESTRGEN